MTLDVCPTAPTLLTMSTTSTQQPLARRGPVPVSATEYDPSEVFDAAAWDNREVCNGCFARIRAETEFEPGMFTSDYAPTAVSRRVGSGIAGNHPADLPTDGPSTWCDACGSEDGRARDETLSQREAVAHCTALADAVERLGVRIDPETLTRVVRKGKQREALQGADTELFRLGVRLAVEVCDGGRA